MNVAQVKTDSQETFSGRPLCMEMGTHYKPPAWWRGHLRLLSWGHDAVVVRQRPCSGQSARPLLKLITQSVGGRKSLNKRCYHGTDAQSATPLLVSAIFVCACVFFSGRRPAAETCFVCRIRNISVTSGERTNAHIYIYIHATGCQDSSAIATLSIRSTATFHCIGALHRSVPQAERESA